MDSARARFGPCPDVAAGPGRRRGSERRNTADLTALTSRPPGSCLGRRPGDSMPRTPSVWRARTRPKTTWWSTKHSRVALFINLRMDPW